MVTDRVVPVFGSGNRLAGSRRVAVLPRCARGGTGSDRAGEETDYARFVDAAHQQLNGPVVLVWDNLNTHVSRAMRELVAARSWLTVYQLPPYAFELNPVEAAGRT